MPTRFPSWSLLEQHRQTDTQHLRDRFANDAERFAHMNCRLGDLLFDFSRNRISETTLSLLCQLADDAQLSQWREAMFTGQNINQSENRAVLHTALRQTEGTAIWVDGQNIMPAVHRELNRALQFAENLIHGHYRGHTGLPITDVVNIGVGGSDLGARMASHALHAYNQGIRVHFAANLDPSELDAIWCNIRPEQTLFIVCSKSFQTAETLLNANWVKHKLLAANWPPEAIGHHFAAVSSNIEQATDFGISAERCFAMFDWVGGRYSVWSAVGLALMCAIGRDHFLALLRGARHMDDHFRHTPHRHNIPVLMALLGIWNQNFLGCQSQVVIPYHHGLRDFPAYLQQLDMESNGKSVTRTGENVRCQTGAAVWGEEGVNCQHAFLQLLHQGNIQMAADFIVPMRPDAPTPANDARHRILVANALAQAAALMRGKTWQEAQNEGAHVVAERVFSGNRAVNILALSQITPENLGLLLAAYEHKVFVQGVIWQINSFDQWGVEYGKVLANNMIPALADANADTAQWDSATQGMMAYFHQCQNCDKIP